MSSNVMMQVLILVIFIFAMYFLLIRPQKKKEKTVNDMRNSLQVGDEIVTIGGICGKIVKTKDDTLIIQVGADKVKFEVMRWSVSSVVNAKAAPKKSAVKEEVEEDEPKKGMPKRLKKTEKEIKEDKPEEKVEEKAEEPEVAEEKTE